MVRCIACKNFSLRDEPTLAQHGFGRCKVKDPHVSWSARYEHDCKEFVAAEDGVEKSRDMWLKDAARKVKWTAPF